MPTLIEKEPFSISAPLLANDAQAEAIAQRLAQFQETMELIDAMPDRRAEAGLGQMPDNIRETAYEDREAALL